METNKDETIFSKESFARQEYEIQFYNFSVEDFKHENFDFVNETVEKSMSESCKIMAGLLEEVNPLFAVKLKAISTNISKNLKVKCREGISKVNELIAEHFTIPDNVVLSRPDQTIEHVSEADVERLVAECEALEQFFMENGVFMNELNEELNSFDKLNEATKLETFITEKAKEQLDVKIGIDLSINTLGKISKSFPLENI